MADAGAMVVAATWHRSRAGSAEHHYDYEPLPGITSGGSSVYTCSRGRGDESGLLYLYLDAETGCWNAKSVDGEVANAQDIEEFGRPAFRALPGQAVRQEGNHLWQCFNASRGIWFPASPFRTTTL